MIHVLLASMRHRALRTATAITTTALTMAVLTLTAGGLRRAQLYASRTPDFIAVTSANMWLDLPLGYATKLRELPGVRSVEYFNPQFALDATPEHNLIGLLDAASGGYFQMNGQGLLSVTPELEEQWQHDRQGLISSQVTAEKMGWKSGQSISLTWQDPRSGAVTVTPFTFLGTYQGVERESLVVHYDYVDQLLVPEHQGRTFLIGVFPGEGGSAASIQKAVADSLQDVPDSTIAGPAKEWVMGSVASELALTSLLEKLCLVMISITCVIVATTISMSLRERRTEIATLRAMGFTRGRVLSLILAESLTIGLAAYVIGVALPVAVLHVSGRGINLGESILADIQPGGPEMVLAALAVAALSFVICIWPALSASRQDVVTALQEG